MDTRKTVKDMMIGKKLSLHLQKINIIHVILVSFSIHMFVISQPNLEILDERYFTVFVRWFMLGIDHTPYQLPGLSFIVAPFVYLFGDNWFSWRFPIIIFGMIFLYFNYKVIEHISNKKFALITTIILSFSPVIFVHSSLLLRDIPVMALGFMGLYLYLKQKYYFSMLVIGLSALIKETAIFFVMFIVLHYFIMNYRDIMLSVISGKIKRIKTPMIMLCILSLSFLIPLTIYDNTVTVLEYTTKDPEYLTIENGETGIIRFDVRTTNTELLEKVIDDFNYKSKINNPIDHLRILFTNGYYNENLVSSNQFLASFLPIQIKGESILDIREGYQITSINDKWFETHENQFSTLWIQSTVNYSWWHIAFWSCIVLIGYVIFQRIKNEVPISKDIIFIFCGFTFFIPFLIINVIRDTFAYYMIYFLPIMAFGLTSIIYKISNKTLRFLIFTILFLAVIGHFIYLFPVSG